MKQIIPLLLLLFLFSACEKVIDLSDYRPNPKLVINSMVTAGEPIRIDLTRTWFYQDRQQDILIKDADVKLYINDVLRESAHTVIDSINGFPYPYYGFSTIPTAKDRIRITASQPGFPDAEATIAVPEPYEINKMDIAFKRDTITVWEEGVYIRNKFTVNFDLRDKPGENNYYLIYFREGSVDNYFNPEDTTYVWRPFTPDYSKVGLFAHASTAFDKIFGYDGIGGYYGVAFSDELFEGKEYHFDISWENNDYIAKGEKDFPPKFKMYLYAISHDYYNYMKTINELMGSSFTGDLAEAGFAEPIRVYSNIKGGTGIAGGCYMKMWEIE